MVTITQTRLENLAAAQLLAIPVNEPERLFSGDDTQLVEEFKFLAKRWHPDRNPGVGTDAVFAHLTRLREAAREALKRGIWRAPGELQLTATNGKSYRLKYRKQHEFELGEFYVGTSFVAYCVRSEFKDLYEQALARIRGLKFANDAMREEMVRFLPSIKAEFTTADRLVIVFNKASDFVLLGDLQRQQGGKLDPKHTAWILSRLGNISCYLQFAGLTHNAVAPDTVFVSPQSHQAALLGGWWYSAVAGNHFLALPDRTLALAPPDILTSRKASSRLDQQLILATGRELLGDPLGSQLRHDKAIPAALSEWLTRSPQGTAQENYRHWQQVVLPQSFGPRRFVKLNVGFEDVYPQP